ncbi:Ras family protein [Dictyocaulus viviparus]|uniref:Ras family protein n=1 Tax=Dictyocaulus viviparus TaxID=29172 RepID=A0A0D8XS58_DICVI|nr:Ras family protein [Dictyocaulus viviparus]
MTDLSEPVRTLKCVLVGDAAVGKTSLIVSYTTNGYPQHYVPTAFDNYSGKNNSYANSVVVRVDKKPIRLQLCDTAGQPSFDSLRPLSYPDADVFVIVYSVVDPQSFAEIAAHWFPEVIRGNPVAQVLLVGTQVDLRWQTSKNTVSTAKGRQLASQIGAEFFECSALTQHNLKQMFDSAILAALEGRRTIKSPRPQQPQHNSKLKQGFHRIMSITRRFI